MNNTAASEALQQGGNPPGIDASQCLKDFDDHLLRVKGLAPRTRQGYSFWVSRGGLEAAVPRMPRWRQAELPRYLPSADVERVVGGALDGTPRGIRNHAILLLLARTGLRADEVSKLSLDDIDWVAGTICIRSTKSRRERRLPLAQDVGAAL